MGCKIMNININEIEPFLGEKFTLSDIVDINKFSENIRKYNIPQYQVALFENKFYSLVPFFVHDIYNDFEDNFIDVRVFEVDSKDEIKKLFLMLNFPYYDKNFLEIFDTITTIKNNKDISFKDEYFYRMEKINDLSFFRKRNKKNTFF